MKAAFLDTNILIRYFAGDDPHKFHSCDRFFNKARTGQFTLVLTHLAIAEVVWILSKRYQMPRAEIAESFRKLLGTPNIHCEDSPQILDALDLYESKNISFIDAYHASLLPAQGITEFYSYDTDFDQLTGITRREP